MTRFSFTISQRLWLGLSLILALFGVAHLLTLQASRDLDRVLSNALSEGHARSVAVQAMKIQLDTMDRSVRGYLADAQPEQQARLTAAGAAFELALAQYRTPAAAAGPGELADEMAQAYAALRAQIEALVQRRSEQAAARAQYIAHQHDLAALLQKMPTPGYAAREPRPLQRQAAVEELRGRLQRYAALSPDALIEASGRAPAAYRGVRRALTGYRKWAQTREELDWSARVAAWLVREQTQREHVRSFARAGQPDLARLGRLRSELDHLLDTGLQPAARFEMAASVQQASTTVRHANVLAARVLVLALVLGALAALATSRSVRAPLRALVNSTRRLAGGDLAYRVPVSSRDELGELTAAFNDMAERLQASTVSRTYMESIVNSLGEALFVITPEGRIETANPAAYRLLGHAPDSLTGVPFTAIAALELSEDHSELPARFEATLKTDDGALVPVALSAVRMPGRGHEASAIVCIAQDLRERIAADRHQRQTAVVFENTQEGVVLTDAARNIITVNPAFVEITGYSRGEIEGRPLGLLWAKQHQRELAAHVWSEVETRGQWQGEIWVRRKGGELRPVWKNISVVRDAQGRVLNHVAVFSDITAIKDAEERLDYLAYHDPLTDLPNRLLLHDRVSNALDRAVRTGGSVALLYLDLDNFKHVNDTLGHEEGDRLLQALAARIGRCVGGSERIARLGGDEFVVIEEQVRDPRDAAQLAERILDALSAPVELAGLELRMRASIGISIGPQHGSSSEALLKAADAAMYRAKRGRRSGYEFFSEDMTQHALERLTLENALRHPNLGEQLLLHYQPQVELQTGKLVGVEALVRWMHPARGLLTPNAFVPIAEEANLAEVIGNWVLRRACRQARSWSEAGRTPLRMSVNVSAYQLRNDAIVEAVRQALEESGLPPALLELEITEGALQTGEEAGGVLEQLKLLGVQLALDDFGTGYSALSSLKLLPFDRLKIDRSFVRHLEDDANDRALTRAIIAMGRSLDLAIIAEGVETPGQLAFLRKEGCDEIQGFLISAPLRAEELERALLTPYTAP